MNSSMNHGYWVENEELLVADSISGRIVWNGKIHGKSVLKAFPVPGLDQCIVLLSYLPHKEGNRYGDPPNLVCCRSDGTLVWEAEAPDPDKTHQDYYLNVSWKGNMLKGNSSSSFSTEIDVATGKILSQVFTK